LERLIPTGTPFVVINVGDKEPLPNRAVIGDVTAKPLGRARKRPRLSLQPLANG